MGSLPNLNDLRQEKSQRRATAERERDAARERAQQLEHMQRNQLPTLLQVKHKDPSRKIYENLFDYRHRPSPFLLSHTFPFSFPHQRHFSAESWIKWLVWDSFLESNLSNTKALRMNAKKFHEIMIIIVIWYVDVEVCLSKYEIAETSPSSLLAW